MAVMGKATTMLRSEIIYIISFFNLHSELFKICRSESVTVIILDCMQSGVPAITVGPSPGENRHINHHAEIGENYDKIET